MKLRLPLVLLLGSALALTGCSKPETAAPPAAAAAPEVDPIYGHLLHAQPKLPTIKVLLGDPSAPMQEMTAEIAREKVEIATGMMFRTNMPENEAMLFVFPDAEQRSFYMRNCSVALSAAYINPRGEILQIIDMQPHDERGIPSTSDQIQFVLEVPQGWFLRHHVTLGALVRTEKGSLKDIPLQKKP